MIPTPYVDLNDGHRIPQLGFGVFQVEPDGAQRTVEDALEVGFRHIDTASAYRNERGVGAALAASGLTREDVYVTTKLRNGDQAEARVALEKSLERLGVDHVDLYLIHWPVPSAGRYVDAWKEIVAARDEGLVTSIGVSNFLPEHLENLIGRTGVAPAVNQIELHPTFQQPATQQTTRTHRVAIEAYSPLGQGAALQDETVERIAAAHRCTPAQAVLGWHLAKGVIVIPKTTHRERMEENLGAIEVALTEDDIRALDQLDTPERIGNDPAIFDLPQDPPD